MKASWVAALFLGFLFWLMGGKPAFAQGEIDTPDDRRYFPATRHWVGGNFLAAYDAVPDPMLVYGNPITEAFWDTSIDPLHPRLVQYFEKARFELAPENPPELRVVISELGRLVYTPGQSLPTPENFPACRNFPETGKRVCYTFLDFFEDHGGVAQFGYPISNFEIHDQRIVQYFQRARFEWHPELPAGQKVQLTHLGSLYFDLIGEDPERKKPAPPDPGERPQTILELKVRAYPAKPVLPKSGVQTIYITVRDQNMIPVPDAEITLTIKLPSGTKQAIFVNTPTDKHGIASYTFDFKDQPPGMVEILVTATHINSTNIQEQTVTSFRIWK